MIDSLNDIYYRHIEESSGDDVFVILVRDSLIDKVDDVDWDHRAWHRNKKKRIEQRAFRPFLFRSEEPNRVSDEEGSANKGYPGEPGNFGVAHADDAGKSKGSDDGSDNCEEDELSAINEFCFC